VKILDSANLGLNSRIVQNEWFFVRTKIANLQKAELWEQGLDLARHLLTTPEDAAQAKKLLQERDDWAVWALLLSATQKLGHARYTLVAFVTELIC
jgi:N-terminal acetyltransferase B complex non-catalytic subunit